MEAAKRKAESGRIWKNYGDSRENNEKKVAEREGRTIALTGSFT